MPPTLDAIARGRIKAWIHVTGVTQAALAARIGRNQAWMSRYLSGEIDADLETLKQMAEAFSQNLFALLGAPADPADARVIELIHRLAPERRAAIVTLLENLAPDVPGRPRRGRG